ARLSLVRLSQRREVTRSRKGVHCPSPLLVHDLDSPRAVEVNDMAAAEGRCSSHPHVGPNRSAWMAAASWPSSTKSSPARSTNPVGPHMKIRGRRDGGGATPPSISASMRRAEPL